MRLAEKPSKVTIVLGNTFRDPSVSALELQRALHGRPLSIALPTARVLLDKDVGAAVRQYAGCDRDLAIQSYRRSLELNPRSTNARQMLTRLGATP